jgi:6-pyruvoyl-tetrahydropterin synthase
MTRWVIHSKASFEARHALTRYQGEPEESHGHHWTVAIRVGSDGLNTEGYAVDFHAVHDALARAVGPLAGTDLNAHPEIGSPTPSAERLAEVLAGWLAPAVAELGARLLSVSVWEGPENRVDLNLGE